MKYKEVLEKLQQLTPEQLEQTARASGVDLPMFEIGEIWIAREDFIDPSGDGAEPISDYFSCLDFRVDEEIIVIPKGRVILMGLE